MRYATINQIDPAWVLHHFAWECGTTGSDRLVARVTFTPLAWRSTLTDEHIEYREYWVSPATAGLRSLTFLSRSFRPDVCRQILRRFHTGC